MAKPRSLGQFLRAAREAAGMSLRKVEREAGVSNAYLSQLESDRIKEPSPNVLFRLAEFYRADYDTAMRLAGYPGHKAAGAAAPATAIGRLGPVTAEEADQLAEYLAFIRRRRRGSATPP
jgi:transcriptional regulator with XRE-family HTH domain